MGLRRFVEQLLGSRASTNEFCDWAFGKRWRSFKKLEQFACAWNLIHSDLLWIEMDSAIAFDVPEMIQIWREKRQS